jgi:hypothetical protein
LGRDPIGEKGGVLLYGFVSNGSINNTDADGRTISNFVIQDLMGALVHIWPWEAGNYGGSAGMAGFLGSQRIFDVTGTTAGQDCDLHITHMQWNATAYFNVLGLVPETWVEKHEGHHFKTSKVVATRFNTAMTERRTCCMSAGTTCQDMASKLKTWLVTNLKYQQHDVGTYYDGLLGWWQFYSEIAFQHAMSRAQANFINDWKCGDVD